MTGPEHYRKAEELLDSGGHPRNPRSPERIAEAQVHATLAAAAAAGLNNGSQGLDDRDYKAWYDVAGVKPDSPR